MRRPDPKAWILLALVAAVVSACNGRDKPSGADVTASSSTNAASCPTGSVVDVELAAWKQAIEGVAQWPIDGEEPETYPDIAPDYQVLLGELGLRPLPDRTMEELTPEQGVMSLVAYDITRLRRGDGNVPDILVTIHFRNAAGAETLRALVLRPLPGKENSYCSLGDELSHEKESGEQPCIGEHPGFARSLSVESLVAPDRDAIMVRDAGGWCGPGPRRGDRFSTSYWGVEGSRLVRYLEAITAETWYESPNPPAKMQRGRIELTSSWPKTVTITETVECLHVDGDCKPFEKIRTYQYVGNHYAPVDKPARTENSK